MAKKPKPIEQDTVKAWKRIFNDVFDNSPSRKENIEKLLKDASAGKVSAIKKKQDALAKIKRRA